jgi:hypothetical protein
VYRIAELKERILVMRCTELQKPMKAVHAGIMQKYDGLARIAMKSEALLT